MLYVIYKIIGQMLAGAVAALIMALIVQLGTKRVANYKPRYGNAYLPAFLGYSASVIIGTMVGLMAVMSGRELGASIIVLTGIVGFITQAALYGFLIKSPEREPLGFKRGVMVTVIQIIISLLVVAVIAFIAFIVGVL